MVAPEYITPNPGGSTFEGVSPPSKVLIGNGLNRSTIFKSKGVERFRCSVYVPSLTLKKESPVVLENLDRTQWSFDQVQAHVETVVAAHCAVEASKLPLAPPREFRPWERAEDPKEKWEKEAREQLFVALQDGDLHAKGRLSTTRSG